MFLHSKLECRAHQFRVHLATISFRATNKRWERESVSCAVVYETILFIQMWMRNKRNLFLGFAWSYLCILLCSGSVARHNHLLIVYVFWCDANALSERHEQIKPFLKWIDLNFPWNEVKVCTIWICKVLVERKILLISRVESSRKWNKFGENFGY